jgi:hypothetical protein
VNKIVLIFFTGQRKLEEIKLQVHPTKGGVFRRIRLVRIKKEELLLQQVLK